MKKTNRTSFVDRVLNRIEKFFFPFFAKHRRKKLKSKAFTIISNNCWGGVLYEYFGLIKQSPTIGSYFYAEDFVKFCKDIKKYLSADLELISAYESKHFLDLKKKNELNRIVGKMLDVEIVFAHYSDKNQILEKWKRRVQRINWNKIILKFSYQNQCNDDLVKEFLNIKEYKKFVLVGEHVTFSDDEILFARSNGKETFDEMINFDKYINILELINNRL